MITMRNNEKGMTIVELMVSISIMLVVMGGFTVLYVRSLDTNRFILEEGNASFKTAKVVDNIIIDLRKISQGDNGNYPLVSGTNNDLVAFINIDDDDALERVHYYLSEGSIKKGVTNPNAGFPVVYPAGDQSVTTLAKYIVNTAGEPLFSYYNENYPGDVTNNPLSTPVVTGNVRLIKVLVKMNINPNHSPNNVSIESFVKLRNIF